MGQSSTFYEINKTYFNEVKADLSLFKIHEAESSETLEENVFGIEFTRADLCIRHYKVPVVWSK